MRSSIQRRNRRFFTTQTLESAGSLVTLGKEETHHLRDVLRYQEGEECFLFDPVGHEWHGRVKKFSPDGVASIELLTPSVSRTKHLLNLTVAQAIPQRSKFDWMVEKAAELGVARLVPLISERTAARISEEDISKVMNRWDRIIRAAQKQSGTLKPTEVTTPVRFVNYLNGISDSSGCFVLHPAAIEPLALAARDFFAGLKRGEEMAAMVLIGPEGGFSET